MFSTQHEIFKRAWLLETLDEWLPLAENLVEKWATQSRDEIKFETTFEITIASLLLIDDLLPPSARQAFAMLTLDVINEAKSKNIVLATLQFAPPTQGRKKGRTTGNNRLRDVRDLIDSGMNVTQAYELVANKYHKSPSTIRRDFERWKKNSPGHSTGGN